ncbi:conserved hypothetical protein [Pediculus humanus corporis]|uniref:PH domain-containing protein n=1 Tax=Pediculus humanus subsp. corporis TaxID=121224 RepID=E0VCU1_PEDHC|nr:uncharacterized protein Phum_PHUM097440 [Pediculus humanus corporis]EEB11197.1 conserved hypothetical protein [Pediculus humanus corporis]
MKINDKNLAAFATSPTPVDREGWLQKRGEINKGFQKRWFVLKGNLLFYFEKPADKEPLGVIVLEGCTIELAEDEDHFIFKIVFHGAGNRSYILGAYSQESMEQWMKALAFASYDYMKLMVSDLQRQLDEMEDIPTTLDNASIQRVGIIKEKKSPNPPPRQRHNPFNKSLPVCKEGFHYQHQRSQSVKCTSDTFPSFQAFRSELSQKNKISFREIHNLYGRRILADFNEWKHYRKQNIPIKEENNVKEGLLIAL